MSYPTICTWCIFNRNMAKLEKSDKISIPYNFIPRDYQIPVFEAFDNGIKRGILIWHRRCLIGDTDISMVDGSFKKIKDIKEGDIVLSYKDGILQPKTVLNKYDNGIKSVYKYNDLICTKEHSILDNGKFKEIEKAKNLTNVGEMAWGDESNCYLAELLGLLLTDGSIIKNQTPKFTNVDEFLLKRFEYLIERAFPEVRTKRYKKGNGYDILCPTEKKTNYHPIRKFFKSSNTMPDIVWKFDKESTLAFLSGVISGDGSIYYTRKETPRGFNSLTGQMVIEAGISEELAKDYKLLLSKVGIRAKIKKDKRCNNHRIFIYSLKTLFGLMGIKIASKKKQEKLEYLFENITRFKKYRGEKKKNALYIGEEETYDLTIEDNHNYIANGYIVHNCGKDVVSLNLMIKKMFERVGTYFYFFPTYNQGEKILWTGARGDGFKMLDHFPRELVESKNEQAKRIKLVNGSVFQIVGTEDMDKVVGTNPIGCVFSEYALQNPDAWDFVRPILRENGGWALFESTPRGKNHLYKLYEMAKGNPEWFTQRLSIDDTKVMTRADMEKDISEGMDRDLAEQEYLVSFLGYRHGSIYGKNIRLLEKEGRVGFFPHDSSYKVYTAWDIGIRDSTAIWFIQLIGMKIHLIDYYEKRNEGMEHYVNMLQNKPYVYARHYLPHDIKVREWGSGKTRIEIGLSLGIHFDIADKISREEGIDAVKRIFNRFHINESLTERGFDAIKDYHREWDSKKKVYSRDPAHNWASNGSDALRTFAVAHNDGESFLKNEYKYEEDDILVNTQQNNPLNPLGI